MIVGVSVSKLSVGRWVSGTWSVDRCLVGRWSVVLIKPQNPLSLRDIFKKTKNLAKLNRINQIKKRSKEEQTLRAPDTKFDN